jgi:hypothetical protein
MSLLGGTMKKLGVLMSAVLILGLTGILMAADNDEHSVTVTVEAINELNVAAGDAPDPAITLKISTATAGQEPDAVYDETCTLEWTTNEASKKITAETDLAEQKFTLKVLATNVTGGAAAPEVTLSTTATDFVTGVAETTGGCTLKYTASATAAQGTGSDAHTVTYTITGA